MFKKMSTDLVRLVKSAELGGITKEVAEAGFDALTETDGFVKDLPLVGSLVALGKVGASVRDRLLGQKIMLFLDQLNSLKTEERELLVEKLNQDDGYRGRVGERLLEILERIEVDSQPEMAGRAFSAFAVGQISALDLKRLIVVIGRLPPHELPHVRSFYDSSPHSRGTADWATLNMLETLGLVSSSRGFNSGDYTPTHLMDQFVKLI